jgi:hypothetical protein
VAFLPHPAAKWIWNISYPASHIQPLLCKLPVRFKILLNGKSGF